MTVLLVLLAGVWAAVLVPPAVRNRGSRHADSISSFRQQLHTLERARPGARLPRSVPMAVAPIAMRAQAGIPSNRAEARRRRRDILFVLAGTVVITLFLAMVLGGVAFLFQFLADAVLGGYVYLLVQTRRSAALHSMTVRYLPTRTEGVEPALVLQRSASN